ncbi:GntR family transcriptional regulator [Rhodobacteraceae bacterium F11138]|nr:GntR family transcriptional regulator [Rhodobacteraceae bacterium F11138]
MFGHKKTDDGTVVEMLASALRRDISFGTLRPDQKLKIEELRSRYGGSNHSIRETLRLLSAEGLVEATAQRGFRVTSATEDDMRDIALVRKKIEKTAIRRAIELGDTAWEGRVLAAHHALRRTEEAVATSPDDLVALEWDEACRAFSSTVLEACGSPRLFDIHGKYFDQSRRFRLAQLREGRLDFESRKIRQQSLLDAIMDKNVEAAEKLISDEIEAELYI